MSVLHKGEELKQQLEQLACFNSVDTINAINEGHSQQCYQVFSADNVFFAKYFIEPILSLDLVANLTTLAANQGLSPQVVFHNEQWLITRFVNGVSLQQAQLPWLEKMAQTVTLMTMCHQLPKKSNASSTTVMELALAPEINNLFSSLVTHKAISPQLQQVFSQLRTQVNEYEQQSHALNVDDLVVCHGDLNFSNIMINTEDNQHYLIDFDCACLAEVEYDIAMMLAVNEFSIAKLLSADRLEFIIALYRKKSNENYQPLIKKVTCYYFFSSLINGLWYVNQYLSLADKKLQQRAMVQFNQVGEGKLITDSLIDNINKGIMLIKV